MGGSSGILAPASPGSPPVHAVEPAVVARDLAAGYGTETVWAGATFEIGAGEMVGVLGPNGAGKSTLLRLLLGLLRPQRGTVQVLGRPPMRGNPDIGYVPQRRPTTDETSIRGVDLVRLGLDGHRWGTPLPGRRQRAAGRRVADAVAAVAAQPYAGRPVGQLSGGELQRLLLAQALVGEPTLLLLDEPLASLDLRHQAGMAALVSDLARELGLTVLLIAHDVNPLLPVIDRVLYIGRGGVAIGTPGEVITPEVLSRLYEAPVEVLEDSRGRLFVVGLEDEVSHPHGY
ncbi:MAG TPA: ATP-binding cassette domain-containing protein [Acidimicrobiales bacterium]|nr:MAG: ATP-binding cassette domain-containing protein [Actinomycetota bacterium]HMC40999.1 ATP-binding cassette domain-containing protein [Acidimicrobiales bacterium]